MLYQIDGETDDENNSKFNIPTFVATTEQQQMTQFYSEEQQQ